MKVNEVGTETVFENVDEGTVFWHCGAFYMRTRQFYSEEEGFLNAVNIENGILVRVYDNDAVSVYKNANMNLV